MAAKVKALQQWCKRQCDGYSDVSITNMTSSWKNGLAFCAIIHRYHPELINYDALSKDDVFGNNKLAFDVASELLGIPALLDPEDMLTMSVPDKLCIITYVSQYYNYFHDKTPASASELSNRRPNQDDGPSNLLIGNSPSKADANVSNGQRFLSATEDDFLRDMSANVAHRRGSVVDDTCYRCGQRVYLLERHLASTGKLFHRHCYRESERTATLQRAGVRRAPACSKENLLPPSPSSQPEVESTGRTGRHRKSSTSPAKQLAAATGRSDHSANAKLPEQEIPKVAGAVKSSVVSPKKVTAASVTATRLATSTAGRGPTANTPNPTDNKFTSTEVHKSPTPSATNSSIPKINSPEKACYRMERFDEEHPDTKIRKQKIAVDARFGQSPTTGSTCVVDRNASGGDGKDTGRSSAAHSASPPVEAVSVPALANRAHPTLLTTMQAGAATDKKTTSDAVPLRKTSKVSPPSARGTDRSCDVISGPEPARLVVLRQVALNSDNKKERIAATTSGSDASQKPHDHSTLTSSANDRISTPTALESSSYRGSLADVSFSPVYPSFSDDSASITPASAESGASSNRRKSVTESKRSEPYQPRNGDRETSGSAQLRSSAEKQNGLSTKVRQLYKPRSMENLVEPSFSWKPHRIRETLPDNDTEVSSVTKEDTTSVVTSPSSSRPVRRQRDDTRTERPKSSYDFISPTSRLRDGDGRSHEARQNADAKSRNEPMVKDLVENLTKAGRRKLQETSLSGGNRVVERMPDVVESTTRRTAVTTGSKKPEKSAGEAVKHDGTSPDTDQPVVSQSSPTAGLQVAKNKDTLPASPPGRVPGTTPKEDGAPVGKKMYLTKWEAELQRRQKSRLDHRNSSCQPLQMTSAKPSAEKSATTVENSPPLSAAANRKLSSKFSKSVDDLSQMTRPAPAAAAAAAGNVRRCGEQMTDWQLEAERRRATRGGRYVDPEKIPRSQRQNAPPSKMKSRCPENVRKSMIELNDDFASGISTVCAGGNLYVSSLYQSKTKSNFSVSVDNLTQEVTPRSNLRPRPSSPKRDKGREQSKVSASSEEDSKVRSTGSRRFSNTVTRVSTSTTPAESATENYYEAIDDDQLMSPVAELDSMRQNSIADVSMLDDEVFQRLDELDAALRDLELDGRLLEERIRSETDEAMDDKTDDMMVEWFGLVRKRNELVREESALVYKRRQQELESQHSELRHQLQSLMCKPDGMKSQADWQLETSLLRELVDTVTQRSTIVECIENDRLRYQEEDKELEEMIAASGVTVKRRPTTSSKSRRNSIRKAKARSDVDVSQAGNLTKLKKKKFSIFSLARKSLTPKKGVRTTTGNVPVNAQ